MFWSLLLQMSQSDDLGFVATNVDVGLIQYVGFY